MFCYNKNMTNKAKDKNKNLKHVLITIAFLFLGIIAGTLMKTFLPEDVNTFLNTQIFSYVTKIFINGIKLVVVPLVFTSIMMSVSGFGNLKQLGKIGLTIFALFIALSIFAIFLGYTSYHLFPIGDTELASIAYESDASSAIPKDANTIDTENMGVMSFIYSIVPSNIFQVFTSANMLQLIFVAMLLGICSLLMGEKGKKINKALEYIFDLFITLIKLILKCIPLVIFCAMASICLSTELTNLISISQLVGLIYATDIVMILIYMVLIFALARLNPIKFIQKFFEVMLTAFTLSSSSAAMPLSMLTCKEELGIKKEVYSLGIPLGTTINMNGSCITQTITIFFMAYVFGIDITPEMFFTIAITILVLAIGAPGITGGALIAISILLPTAGMPAEGIAIIVGVYPLISMMQTMTNSTGDAVVTTIVAR